MHSIRKTEKFIQQSFDELAKGRTTFIIAHRLATIKNADRIIVVTEDGLTEDGTHEELLAKTVHMRLYTKHNLNSRKMRSRIRFLLRISFSFLNLSQTMIQ